jgi:hypothetical protein
LPSCKWNSSVCHSQTMHTRKYALGRIRCHYLPVLPLSPHRLLSPRTGDGEGSRDRDTGAATSPSSVPCPAARSRGRVAMAVARLCTAMAAALLGAVRSLLPQGPRPAYAPADEAGPAAAAMKTLCPKLGKGGKIRPPRTPSRRHSASSRPQSSSSSSGCAPRTSGCWPTSSRTRSWWAGMPPQRHCRSSRRAAEAEAEAGARVACRSRRDAHRRVRAVTLVP